MIWAQSVYKAAVNKKLNPSTSLLSQQFYLVRYKKPKYKLPAKKLNWKNTGPYKVKKVISPYTYWLKLPDMVKIHPIFYMSVLYPTAPILDALPKQIQDPPLLVKVDGKDKYFIKRINNIKYNK